VPACALLPQGWVSIAPAASRAGKPGTEAARLDELASFALLQLVPDAPELLQRSLQALDDLPRQDRRVEQAVGVLRGLVLEPEDIHAGLMKPKRGRYLIQEIEL